LTHSLRETICANETPAIMIERSRLFYVAVYEAEGEVLGFAGLDMNEIRLLCVSPAHQRRGIGRALLEHIKPLVPGSLFPDVFVYSSLQAVSFYKSCGFHEKGPFDFPVGKERMHTVFMTFSTG
jgi:N-acetylglutamate synthase-like GNAT family acetyltransferase